MFLEEGHLELRVFYRLQVSAPEKHKELLIYIFVATYTCLFSLSNQSHIQNKQQQWLFNDSLLQGPRDHQNFGGSMLTSYVMDHGINIQIRLGYLQAVHLGDQRYLILGLVFISLLPRLLYLLYVL